jgi:hypothetical protein
MRIIKALAVLSVASALVGCGNEMMTANMAAENASNQSGTVTLTETAQGKTRVQINIASASDAALQQPAHIHTGTCEMPGPVSHPLTNVVAGKSTTDLNVDIDEFKKNPNKYIVNVHKSAAEASVYVSCTVLK